MQILVKVIRWTGLFSLPVFLLTIPNSSAMAGNIGSCANRLIANGVTKPAAAAACSDALEPDVLASCVADIRDSTDINGNDVLQACYRVRRPSELANCVTDISIGLEQEKSTMALNNCRRSLLPERYAECTLDLASIAEISNEEAMESCIAAEFRPNQVSPEAEAEEN